MANKETYRISGSYYEACNCDAVCPCRRQDDVPGGRSTSGDCDFLLSWQITKGQLEDIDLSGCSVSIAGTYNDHVGDDIWSVFIYIGETASKAQFDALSRIFSGHVGGNLGVTANFSTILGSNPLKSGLITRLALKPSMLAHLRQPMSYGILNLTDGCLAAFPGMSTRARNPFPALRCRMRR